MFTHAMHGVSSLGWIGKYMAQPKGLQLLHKKKKGVQRG